MIIHFSFVAQHDRQRLATQPGRVFSFADFVIDLTLTQCSR